MSDANASNAPLSPMMPPTLVDQCRCCARQAALAWVREQNQGARQSTYGQVRCSDTPINTMHWLKLAKREHTKCSSHTSAKSAHKV
jgi:hypothetical protein